MKARTFSIGGIHPDENKLKFRPMHTASRS